MHDPARDESEQASDDQTACENRDYRDPVTSHTMAVRVPNAERKHDEAEDRQQMNVAPWLAKLDLAAMYPERTDRDSRHQRDPGPAHGAVRKSAFWQRELNEA